jgi:RecB family exonuclease
VGGWRRAIRPGAPPTRGTLTPDSVTPSGLVEVEPAGDVAGLEVERYGAPLTLETDLPAVTVGTFLHRCFEILGARPDLLGRIPAATGVAVDASVLADVASAVAAFERWLAERFQVESVRREWPLLALNAAGSVVSGTADLIVRTPEGAWIVDHKSDAIEDPKAAFAKYRPQLDAYAAALASGGERVAGVAIHWVRRGEVVVARL